MSKIDSDPRWPLIRATQATTLLLVARRVTKCMRKTRRGPESPRYQTPKWIVMYRWLSAVRADLRRGRYGHLHHHARLRDPRRTPAWASSATGLRAAASCARPC